VEIGGRKAKQVSGQSAKSKLFHPFHTTLCFPNIGEGTVLIFGSSCEDVREMDAAKIIDSVEFPQCFRPRRLVPIRHQSRHANGPRKRFRRQLPPSDSATTPPDVGLPRVRISSRIGPTRQSVNPSASSVAGVRTVTRLERACRFQGWHALSLSITNITRRPSQAIVVRRNPFQIP
jgi:hypothetical protein